MLSPKLTNCINCTSISALLSDIDCKLFIIAKQLYNNTVFDLNKSIDGTVASDLLNYKRILSFKHCNADYASKFTIEQIASRIKILKNK
jgi:hypothetical protein